MQGTWFRRVRPLAAAALVAGLAASPVPAAAPSAEGLEAGHGSIHGTLFQPDEKAPLAGGKVTAINGRTGQQYPSNDTTDNGNYDIGDLPAGTYDLVDEGGGNRFVADHIVHIATGG